MEHNPTKRVFLFMQLALISAFGVNLRIRMGSQGDKTFLYFGYGSNMLEERIHVNNPSAKLVSYGTLKNYQFGFERILLNPEDYGGIATIRPGTAQDFTMGVVWQIDTDQLEHLDRQERHYKAIEVDVTLQNGTVVQCRTYEMVSETDPVDKRPHPFYKKICVEGAKQHQLPQEYIQFLESFEDSKKPRRDGFYDELVPVFHKIDQAKTEL